MDDTNQLDQRFKYIQNVTANTTNAELTINVLQNCESTKQFCIKEQTLEHTPSAVFELFERKNSRICCKKINK